MKQPLSTYILLKNASDQRFHADYIWTKNWKHKNLRLAQPMTSFENILQSYVKIRYPTKKLQIYHQWISKIYSPICTEAPGISYSWILIIHITQAAQLGIKEQHEVDIINTLCC